MAKCNIAGRENSYKKTNHEEDVYKRQMLFYAIVLIVMMLINWAPKAIEMRERLFSKIKKKEA